MASSFVAKSLVVVALVAFYGGLARDLAATAEFLDPRLGVGFSLVAYVAAGVGGLLALATVAVEVTATGGETLAVATGVGLAVLFTAVYAAFFRAGTVLYGVLLRAGFRIT